MPAYVIRIFKSWGGRDSGLKWVNNYEVFSAAASPADLRTMANAISDAERPFHLTNVDFLGYTVSTWQAEGPGYNPESFVSVPLSGNGSRVMTTGAALDINVAWHVSFKTALGRAGRRFYRGVLMEADVETTGNLSWRLVPGVGLASGGALISAFQTALGPYFSGGANVNKLAIVTNSPTNDPAPAFVREVIGIDTAGVSINKRNHKYFDRAAG